MSATEGRLPPVVTIDDSFGEIADICINTAVIETAITVTDYYRDLATIVELNLFDLSRLIEVLTVSRDFMKKRQS